MGSVQVLGVPSSQLIKSRRGTGADFERLVDLGVDLEGKIALIRYGSIFRGLKVKNAQDRGMIGAIIFTDPADDGNITVANGYEAYPGKSHLQPCFSYQPETFEELPTLMVRIQEEVIVSRSRAAAPTNGVFN